MTRVIALMALAALGLSGTPVHEPVHERRQAISVAVTQRSGRDSGTAMAIDDPLYVLTVDPARLVPHLDGARSASARAAAAVYRQNAHLLADLDRPMRASHLELMAHHLGCRGLAARIASAAPDRPLQTRWSDGRRGRCRTAPRSSSSSAEAARCRCGGWPTAPRLASR